MYFDEWQRIVELYLVEKCGMGIEDLPDYDYWEAWDNGENPKNVAEQVIENARRF